MAKSDLVLPNKLLESSAAVRSSMLDALEERIGHPKIYATNDSTHHAPRLLSLA